MSSTPSSAGSIVLDVAVLLIPEGAKFKEVSSHCPLVAPDPASTKPLSSNHVAR